jgi:hypothetical protein
LTFRLDTFEIIDGVRRAKAADLLDHGSVWAVVDDAGAEQRVPVGSLLSPKRTIDISTPRERQRWINVKTGMADEPDLLPPIIVRRGSRGLPIRDVRIVGGPP